MHFSRDPLLNTNRIRVSILVPGVRLPTLYAVREAIKVGGLISYGPNRLELEISKRGYNIESMLRAADAATTWDKDEA